MIYLLCICVFGLFVLSAIVFKRDFTAPAVLITLGFVISLLCCCIYADEWNFSDYRLFWVIISGLSGFILACWLAFVFVKKRKTKSCKITNMKISTVDEVDISNIKLTIYLGIQLVFILFQIYDLYRNSRGGSLAYAIGYYYSMNSSGTLEYKSQVLNIAGILIMPANYIILYVLARKITHRRKVDVLLILNVGVSIVSSLLSGTRTTLFMYAISFSVMFIIQKQRVTKKKMNINLKNIIKFFIVFYLAIVVFSSLFSLQGRTISDLTMVDLIANYLGAPIKNLELFIKDNITNNGKPAGSATFMNTYTWLNELIGKQIFDLPNLYKYRWNKGKILGNVYTQFMPLYYDYGIVGVFFVMFILGFFCQKIYNKVKMQADNNRIDYRLILYSYTAFAIVFCFFSNKFFELIFARAMIYNIVGILFFDILFFRLQVKEHGFVIRIR